MDPRVLERRSETRSRRARGVISFAEFVAAGAEQRLHWLESGALASAMSPRERVVAVLRFARPRTAVVGVIAFALGASYGGPAPAWRVAVLAIAMFWCPALANMLNTCTDVSEDNRNLPGRVFLLGRYGRRALERTCAGLGVALLSASLLLGIEAFLGMLLCLAVIHQYSLPPLSAKRHPLLGLVVFAQAVSLPFLMGAVVQSDAEHARRMLAGGDALPDALRFGGMAAFLFVWFVAKGMFKNVPDYAGDRQAGIRTSATVFDSRRSAAVATLAVTLAAYLSLALVVALGLAPLRVLAALVWLVPVAYNGLRLVRASSAEAANHCLKVDMFISTGFLSTVLALVAPTLQSMVIVGAGILVIVLCDWLQIDTRRSIDTADEGAD